MTPLASAGAAPIDKKGWAALIVGTGIIAWSGVLARFLDVGPLAGAAWRMGLAVPALAVWVGATSRGRIAMTPPAALIVPIVLAGLAFAVDVGASHLAITGTKVANVAFIGNVAPILAVVGAAALFAEQPPPRVWFALALALFGSWTMAGLAAPGKLGYGDICALCAALAYAVYLLVIKGLRSRLDGPTATLWSAAVSAVVVAAAAVLHGEVLVPRSLAGWTVVVLLGVVSHAMGQGLTSVAVGRVPVGLVALVILAQPPVSAAIAWAVLGETMNPLELMGGATILSALLLARPK